MNTQKRFRLDGKQFFATFPQNETTKEDAMNRLKEHFKDNLEYAIVAQEKHKDGNHHLHITFKTLNRYTSSKSNCFDFIGDKHGDYKTADKGAIIYTTKDGDYIEYNIDVKKYLKNTTKKTTTSTTKGIFKQITDNIDIHTEYKDILLKYPDICLQHGKKIKDYIRDYREAHRPRYRDWEMNVSYYYGKTGTGKSREAYKDFNPDTHYILGRPQGGTIWFDGYTGQETIIIDDFSHRDYSLTYMLNLLDRYAMPIQYKGGTTQMLAKNIIITSNYSPDTLYRGVDNPEHRNAFLRRIHRFKHFISPDDIKEYKSIEDIHNIPIDTIENTDTDTDTDDITDDNTKNIIDTTKDIFHIHSFNTEKINADRTPSSYRCHICGDTFRTQRYLNIHSRIHSQNILINTDDKNKENT